MAHAAFELVGMGIFLKMDQLGGFDLWLYGKNAREMLGCCEDAYLRFKCFPPKVRKDFLHRVARSIWGYGKLNKDENADNPSLDLAEVGKSFLNLGPLVVIPATLYILQREGRLEFDGYNGCVLMTRRVRESEIRFFAITRRSSNRF